MNKVPGDDLEEIKKGRKERVFPCKSVVGGVQKGIMHAEILFPSGPLSRIRNVMQVEY